ncbi:MAG: hypothetical protein ACREQ5_17675 [Candidatus Dormibacteria bacterium]
MTALLPDTPVTGYYRTKLVRGGVFVPVKLWWGAPIDPEDYSQTLDRSPRWQALVDGELFMGNVLDVWAFCAGRQISEAEYRFMVARASHARTYDTGHPSAEPRRPVDFNRIPLVF